MDRVRLSFLEVIQQKMYNLIYRGNTILPTNLTRKETAEKAIEEWSKYYPEAIQYQYSDIVLLNAKENKLEKDKRIADILAYMKALVEQINSDQEDKWIDMSQDSLFWVYSKGNLDLYLSVVFATLVKALIPKLDVKFYQGYMQSYIEDRNEDKDIEVYMHNNYIHTMVTVNGIPFNFNTKTKDMNFDMEQELEVNIGAFKEGEFFWGWEDRAALDYYVEYFKKEDIRYEDIKGRRKKADFKRFCEEEGIDYNQVFRAPPLDYIHHMNMKTLGFEI